MKKWIIYPLLLICFGQIGAKEPAIYHKGWIDYNKNGIKDVYEDSSKSVEARVANLLFQMTLEEKSCQLATLYGFGRVLKDSLPTEQWKQEVWKDGIANIDEQLNGVGSGYRRAYRLIYPFANHAQAINTIQRWFIEETRLGIPVDFSNEGIHGLNHTKATPLPAPIAMGSTWNPSLVRKAGEIIGMEAKQLGYTTVYAPILDVVRDPRWGRVVETYGESPYLIATLGIQMVKGIQSQGVGSTLKHFAAYSVPKGGRDGQCRTDSHITPRALHELFLYPFRRVIQEAKPLGVMSSYNDWNGEPITASSYFLTTLLRNTFGFDGLVVSDSEAVEFVQTKHQVAGSYEEAVRQVLVAGLNVRTHFTPPADFILPVRQLVKEKKIPLSVVDQRVAEVLSVKFRLGIFDSPLVKDPTQADQVVGADKHLAFVRKVQAQSLVLLKNKDQLLPLKKEKIKKLCVVGPLADEANFMTSRYGPNGLPTITVLEGLKKYLEPEVNVTYQKGCEVVDKNWPDSEIVPTPLDASEKAMMQKAVNEAATSDVIVAVFGEDDDCVGESRSRTSLALPGRQQRLLQELQATGKPVVLVLINGQPLTINWADRNIPSILEAWFPSYRGGEVIAQTLFGEYNPGGKLTVTFPKTIGQIELNFPFKKGSQLGQDHVGPNGSGNTRVLNALYPFGYGLSYTQFAYSNLQINTADQESKGEIKIKIEVKNTGNYKGDEIVQLYVQDKVSSVVTYDSLLRGFERITLNPNETKTVSFVLHKEDLEVMDKNMHWTVEPGEFEVRIGASSTDIKAKKTIRWK